MKKSKQILRSFLALLMLLQGASLVATCAVPCHMSDAAMLRCVLSGLSDCDRAQPQDKAAALRPGKMACGSIGLKSPLASISGEKPLLRPAYGPAIAARGSASQAFSSSLKPLNFNRAGPLAAGPSQALLAVPPQNAPPVLA